MGQRLRFVFDVVVEEDQYLGKCDWNDAGEMLGNIFQNVFFQKYGIVVEKTEKSDHFVHVHNSTPDSNCEHEYGLAEDGKNGNN